MTTLRKLRPRPTFRAPAYVPVEGPRPDASKIVAAQKRARPVPTLPDAPILPRQWLSLAAAGVLLILAMIALATYGVPQRPTALAITPSAIATNVPAALAVPTSTPVRLEPTAAPTAAPEPVQPATEEPAIGRGLTIDVAPPAPTPAPTYLEVVAAQAPHSPRGGLCGPNGGDCAPGVPVGIDSSQYIANVARQAPHKVR